MAQVIQDDFGIGSALGSGLGTGLGTALQSLAQNKLQNILTRQQALRATPGLTALGIPQQEAQNIAMLPEALQSLVIKNYLQAAETAGLDQALQQLSGQQLPPQNDIPLEMLAEAPVQQPRNPFASMQEIAQSLQKAPYPTQEQKPSAANAPRSFANLLKSPRLTPEHRLKVAALQQQQQKISQAEQREVNSETKPYYDEISKEAKAAKFNNIRLDRMQELIKKGELTNPLFASLFNSLEKGVFGAGVDLKFLENPDSQEFRKLSNDFVRNAKDYFGNRLTDADLKAFMASIPTLLQTDEGKSRVIRNMKMFNDIALYKKKAADEVIRANGGKRPSNFSERVDELADPYVEKLATQFKADTAQDIEKEGWQPKSPLVRGVSQILDAIRPF